MATGSEFDPIKSLALLTGLFKVGGGGGGAEGGGREKGERSEMEPAKERDQYDDLLELIE